MKTKRWLALTVALLMLLVTACSAAPESTTAPEDGAPSDETSTEAPADGGGQDSGMEPVTPDGAGQHRRLRLHGERHHGGRRRPVHPREHGHLH